MCKAHDHTIHGTHHHFGWDHSIPPVLTVAPGTTIEFECLDASGGQLTKDSTLADVGALDFAKVNPVTGPVCIDGAAPGDAVKVVDGPFNNFTGFVDEVYPDKMKVKVMVSIFGRKTPLELDYLQVEHEE